MDSTIVQPVPAFFNSKICTQSYNIVSTFIFWYSYLMYLKILHFQIFKLKHTQWVPLKENVPTVHLFSQTNICFLF